MAAERTITRRTLLIWGTLATAAGLAQACSPATSPPAATPASTKAGQPAASPVAQATQPPTAKPAQVEIQVWAEFSQGVLVGMYNAFMKMIAEFEKANPDIRVKYQGFSFNEHRTTVKTAVLTGGGPDVLISQIGAECQDLYYAEGKLVTLDQYALAHKWLDRYTDVNLVKTENGANPPSKLWNGPELAALTFWQGNLAIYYNKDLWDKVGITKPGPKEWDKFIQSLEALEAAGHVPMLMGNLTKTHFVHYASAFIARGVSCERQNSWMFPVNGCKVRFTDPDFVKSISMLADFGKKGYFNADRQAIDFFDNHYARVYKGDVGCWLGGDYVLEGYKGAPIKVDAFLLPTWDPNITAGVPGWPGWGMAIPKASKHQDQAVKFMDAMLTPEMARIWVAGGNISPLKYDASGLQIDPLLKTVQEIAMSGPMSQNIDLACLTCYDVQAPNGQLLMEGKQTPEQFCAAVDKATVEYGKSAGFCT